MIPKGYCEDCHAGSRIFLRLAGEFHIILHCFTGCWGYTFWKGAECVAGQASFNWSLEDAATAADEAFAFRCV